MNHNYTFSLLILALVLTSCQKENLSISQIETVHDSFYATIEQESNDKTYLNEWNQVCWQKGDQVAFFSKYTVGLQFQIDDDAAGKTSGTFTRITPPNPGFTGEKTDVYVSYYPYSETLRLKAVDKTRQYTLSGISFPTNQVYDAAHRISQNTLPMVGITDQEDGIPFKNLGGILELQLKGQKRIRKITLRGNQGEFISGEGSASLQAGEIPACTLNNSSAKREILLDCGPEGIQLQENQPETFAFALPPTVFEKGFTVILEDTEGGTMKKSTEHSLEVRRSRILRMEAFQYAPVYPVIHLDNNKKKYELNYESSQLSIPYTIENPVDGESLVLSCSSSWISNLKTESGKISFTVSENKATARDAEIHLNYPGINDVTLSIHQKRFFGVLNLEIKGVKYPLIPVEGGTFKMGATSEQVEIPPINQAVVHSVSLTDYYIGQCEVYGDLWCAVMEKGEPRGWNEASWNEIVDEFLPKLNEMTRETFPGMTFTLPTEAQWEYAARGGRKSQGYRFSGSNDINDVACWYFNSNHSGAGQKSPSRKVNDGGHESSRYPNRPQKLKPNELNIYDMSGNISEWCSDWYGAYDTENPVNPTGPENGTHKVIRGGNFLSEFDERCSNAYRDFWNPDYPDRTQHVCIGFRLALQFTDENK